MQIRINEFFGLPAHSFLIHLVVVLLPIAAIAAMFLAWRSDLRHRRRLPFLLLVLAGVLSVWVVSGSGEELHDALKASDPDVFKGIEAFPTHEDRGRGIVNWATAFGVAAVALLAVDFFGSRIGGGSALAATTEAEEAASTAAAPTGGAAPAVRWVTLALQVAVTATAAWATYLLILTGHSGAQSVWG